MKQYFRLAGAFAFMVITSIVLFSFAMFQGGFVSWFLFYSFLPIALYQLGVLFYPISNWKVSRSSSGSFFRAGVSASMTIRIERKLPFPLHYCICEEVIPDTLERMDIGPEKYHNLGGADQSQDKRQLKKVIFLGFRRVVDIPYTISNLPRGEHQLKAIRIRTGDLFGLVKKEHVFRVDHPFHVYPAVRLIYMSGQLKLVEEGSGKTILSNVQHANAVGGVREYVPGDRMSWIDWKQTARKNAVMTKEFEQETHEEVLVVLDSCVHPGMDEMAFEAAVELTDSLIEKLQKKSVPIRLLSIGERAIQFPATVAERRKISQHLMRIQPGSMQPFAIKLRKEQFRMTGTVILVTTHIDEHLKRSLQQIKRQTTQIVILFIPPLSTLTTSHKENIRQLEMLGIIVDVLGKEKLVKNPVEVSLG